MRIASILFSQKIILNGIKFNGEFHPETKKLIKGTAELPDGRIYSGQFDAVKGFPLPGNELKEQGDIYIGEYNDKWQRHGTGKAFLLDGSFFEGVFKNDELVEGMVKVPDGASETVYIGTLENEEFKMGELQTKHYRYVGSFKGNVPHGKGKMEFFSGAEQEGTFYNGRLHGQSCRMKLESGYIYTGEFCDGACKNGQLLTPTYTYEGEFSADGRANGEGTQIYLGAAVKLIFKGVWLDGNLLRGTCVDEYGNNVDMINSYDLKKEVIGVKGTNMTNFAVTAMQDKKDQVKNKISAYAKDVFSNDGKKKVVPSAGELYAESSGLQEKSMKEIFKQEKNLSEQSGKMHLTENYKKRMLDIHNLSDNINKDLVRSKIGIQEGANLIAADNLTRQYNAYTKKDTKTGEKNLYVDHNYYWNSV